MSEFKQNRVPNVCLTVVIRDISPFLHIGDSPTHRSVKIELTQEQLEKIQLIHLGIDCGRDVYEAISTSFLEEKQS